MLKNCQYIQVIRRSVLLKKHCNDHTEKDSIIADENSIFMSEKIIYRYVFKKIYETK